MTPDDDASARAGIRAAFDDVIVALAADPGALPDSPALPESPAPAPSERHHPYPAEPFRPTEEDLGSWDD